MKKLNSIFRGFLYVLPAVLFFSYYPVISFGSDGSMNFELSLPLVWLVLFDVISLIILIRDKKSGGIFKWWVLLLFPLFVTFSLIWSRNLTRGILTTGIMWLIYFAIYSIISLRKIFYDERGSRYTFLKVFFGSSLLICLWCLIQCILDTAGVTRDYSLMCRGCVSQMFGFPHPNGFAIEPQFMGNLLLAPTLVAIWLYIKKQDKKYLLYFFVFAATLFLTFSRGAIYAFVVGMMFMSGFLLVREKGKALKRLGIMWGLIVISFLFTLNLQGIFAQVGPTNDTYGTGVAKALNQLSLGIIDFRSEPPVSDETSEVVDDNDSTFDGYVEESTSIRMELTKNAVEVWSKDFKTIMFGVGIGGAGQAMYDYGLIWSPKEIVQNEYASLLLEVGLFGIVLIIISLVIVIRILVKSPSSGMILTLMVAYLVTLLFFSGLPNALQIYLLPPVLYMVFLKKFVS